MFRYVAPFVGAWIEINKNHSECRKIVSLRSSERGLKSMQIYEGVGQAIVAPFVGAWIEMTTASLLLRTMNRSLRSSERGLKSVTFEDYRTGKPSLRSSERGLKYS